MTTTNIWSAVMDAINGFTRGRIRLLEERNKEQQKALSGNPLATPV
ncbi:1905_t:CDS:2 [Gigaspora rosea]|nr:1905_t:CDS:2 [Gigaspora rosea]